MVCSKVFTSHTCDDPQCEGNTKHAECRVPRCYRQTRNTNGHCYDHQPNGFVDPVTGAATGRVYHDWGYHYPDEECAECDVP